MLGPTTWPTNCPALAVHGRSQVLFKSRRAVTLCPQVTTLCLCLCAQMYVDEALNSNGRPEGSAGDDPAKLQRHGEMANVQTVHALLFGKYRARASCTRGEANHRYVRHGWACRNRDGLWVCFARLVACMLVSRSVFVLRIAAWPPAIAYRRICIIS